MSSPIEGFAGKAGVSKTVCVPEHDLSMSALCPPFIPLIVELAPFLEVRRR